MKKYRFAATTAVALTVAMTASVAQAGVTGKDESMIKLATHAGCLTCHSIDGKPHEASDDKPVGPAWRDVANKYRGQKDAADKLTQTVQRGSNPYEKHWKETSGLAMPPNAVAISEADTRKLVGWILSLDK